MKRELKVINHLPFQGCMDSHKAYPDEKGTESYIIHFIR